MENFAFEDKSRGDGRYVRCTDGPTGNDNMSRSEEEEFIASRDYACPPPSIGVIFWYRLEGRLRPHNEILRNSILFQPVCLSEFYPQPEIGQVEENLYTCLSRGVKVGQVSGKS